MMVTPGIKSVKMIELGMIVKNNPNCCTPGLQRGCTTNDEGPGTRDL